MKKDILLYPTLEPNQVAILEPSVEYIFQYKPKLASVFVAVHHSVEKSKFITLDSKSEFDWEQDDLIIKVEVKIKNVSSLFGPEGVAPEKSKIGTILESYSRKAKFRTTSISTTFVERSMKDSVLSFNICIPKGRVEGELDLNVLLYLAEEADHLNDDESFLNNIPGAILGVLDTKTLCLTGNGSLFPIINKPSTDNKLWSLVISYDDPALDKLSDSIQLLLNTKHKDYEYLDQSSPKYCDQLILEIVANAVVLIVEDLRSRGYLGDLSGEYDDGSILQFVKYLKNVIRVDLSDASSLSSSLRDYLERND